MSFASEKIHVDDFDQLAEVLQGWETQPVQLSTGRLDLFVESLTSDSLSLLLLSLAPRIADRAAIHAGIIAFVLVERPQIWCGIEIKPPALLVMKSGREMRSVLSKNFRSLEFYFKEEDIVNHPLGLKLRHFSFDPERSVFTVDNLTAFELRTVANAAFNGHNSTDAVTNDFILDTAIRHRLLTLLERIIAPHFETPVSIPITNKQNARTRLAIAAVEEIDRAGVCNLKLTDLYGRLGVSRRTLELAFTNVLGVSPGQYLLANRLNQARTKLAKSNRSIVSIALEVGCEDPSRFAGQYRRLFGELPSQTLQRRHR